MQTTDLFKRLQNEEAMHYLFLSLAMGFEVLGSSFYENCSEEEAFISLTSQ